MRGLQIEASIIEWEATNPSMQKPLMSYRCASVTRYASSRLVPPDGWICAIGKYVGLGFTPWTGTTRPTHRHHLTSVTFATEMASFSYLNLISLFYSYTNLASITELGNLSNVRQMRYTFSSCAFTTIDFRDFGPPTLTDLFYTFSGCSHLTAIYEDPTWGLPSSGIYVGRSSSTRAPCRS